MLGKSANVHFEAECISEKSTKTVYDDDIEGMIVITCTLDHALKFGAVPFHSRGARIDIILFPMLGMPDAMTGDITEGERGAKVKTLWIRAASFRDGIMPHLAKLSRDLGVAHIEPQAHFVAPPFFRMLAKIAHAFAVAETGVEGFDPFLMPIIVKDETSDSVQYIGGIADTEAAGLGLHEVTLLPHQGPAKDVLKVRIRLLSVLETPTYFVAVGRHLR